MDVAWVALAAIALTACGANSTDPCSKGYEPPEHCPTPVVVCDPCALTGEHLELDISKVDLSKTGDVAVVQLGGGSAGDATVQIDGFAGRAMTAPDGTVLFSFSGLPLHAQHLVYSPGAVEAGDELDLTFLDALCELGNRDFAVCPE